MRIGADGAAYCVKYWSIALAAGVSMKDGGHAKLPTQDVGDGVGERLFLTVGRARRFQ